MKLVLKLGAREVQGEVRRDGDLYEVILGEGETAVSHRVDAAHFSPGHFGLLLDGGQQREVAVRATGEGTYEVSAAGASWEVEVADPLTYLARTAGGGGTRRRQGKVNARMPGRVVAIHVQAGAEVAAGTPILTLEAMKMQNEIQAEDNGKVKAIFVTEGQPVEGGTALFEME